MVYIEGVGYVDERSYNASQKLNKSNKGNDFDSILQKETTIYATPESALNQIDNTDNLAIAPAKLEQYFQNAAKTYNVDLQLLKAVAKQESDFNPDTTSSAGAMGIMQIMPGSASELGLANPYDAEQNIMAGAKYLSQLSKRYNGDLSLTLAAYNAGPGNVEKYGGVPPFQETIDYIQKVTGYMGQDLAITNTIYSTKMNNNENIANTIYAIAAKDVSNAPKYYTVYSKPETTESTDI